MERHARTATTVESIVIDINSMEKLCQLMDNEAENLCRVLRKPGGMLVNPNVAERGSLPRFTIQEPRCLLARRT